MTATTLQQTETTPDDYPEVEVSTAAEPFLPAAWTRIETYTAVRTSERDVSWIVEGCGEWVPPLKPATIATVEIWEADAWAAVTLRPSHLGGYVLPGDGPYRFSGTAGDDDADVPADLAEAVRRLAEFMAAASESSHPGLRSETVPDIWTGEYDNRATARALQDSGAADLLRNYRRA